MTRPPVASRTAPASGPRPRYCRHLHRPITTVSIRCVVWHTCAEGGADLASTAPQALPPSLLGAAGRAAALPRRYKMLLCDAVHVGLGGIFTLYCRSSHAVDGVVRLLVHVILDSLTYSVPLFLK